MKHLTKFSLVAAICGLLGAAAAQADDQQLTNRLLIQREQSPSLLRATTVAVYAGNGGMVGVRDSQEQEPAVIYEWRPNGHGQLIGMYRVVQQ